MSRTARAVLPLLGALALTAALASPASAATANRTTVEGGQTYNLSLTAPNTAARTT
ncbi:hypothetical protein GCM10010329_06150 [Streptomyces spiroverticillatus]|uniref:Uncharacterized protein n=1 Tax=Streptomyces finlayi TaxID=67296 RepID=A0A918WT02_9ACTN|nr:hypothetical protein [Streptomyces finlayi]GGZ88720.1 hypothetical protein GCM10010329_06150 [Streptomyces spiroverticillatus]GHC79686.1 hypothetical protein GCM10010334_06130 [Streptomyces finlayi]